MLDSQHPRVSQPCELTDTLFERLQHALPVPARPLVHQTLLQHKHGRLLPGGLLERRVHLPHETWPSWGRSELGSGDRGQWAVWTTDGIWIIYAFIWQKKAACNQHFLTHAPTGGGLISAPLRFFMNNGKTAARSAVKFCKTIHPSILHDSVSGDLLPFKVRSPSHLEWPTSSLICVFVATPEPQVMTELLKVGECYKVMLVYNLYISDFSYWWPELRSISWPPHYKSMGEKPNHSFTHQIR